MTRDDRPHLRIAHSPDPDDAFMWWALTPGEDGRSPMETGRFRFEPVFADIESLNQRSCEGDLEITAMSCAQYPHVRDTYAITACGSSMGDGYGPKLVSRDAISFEDLRSKGVTIATPGDRTTAFLITSLILGPGTFSHQAVMFSEVIARVQSGEFEAGIVIHEGQLTYESAGLHLVQDLGAWWFQAESLPLPLGVNAIRRDLEDLHGAGALSEIAGILRGSIEYGMAHREEAVRYALRFARDVDFATADEFVRLYANDRSVDCGEEGRRAIQRLLGMGYQAGLSPDPGSVELIRSGAVV